MPGNPKSRTALKPCQPWKGSDGTMGPCSFLGATLLAAVAAAPLMRRHGEGFLGGSQAFPRLPVETSWLN